MRITDISRYQIERPDPLDLVKAKAAGITAVNIALDRGRSQDVLSGWAGSYADKARSLGLGISVYRWLDARLSGADHARRALARIRELGGPDGMAHAVDCEDTATLPVVTDYVNAMQDGLGRPIAIYTGRWWMKPRGWNVAVLSPFLWAAPSPGYLPEYPGDLSPHWDVDYGGYLTLSLIQYSVHPLPGAGDCSLTAVRDPTVWATLTGAPTMPTYTQLQAERWYNEELATPEMRAFGTRLCTALGVPAANFGSKGDNAHLNGGHRSQAWIENSRYCTNRTYAVEPGLSAEEKRWLSAFDITPKTRAQMLQISQNLDRVVRSGALEEVVEWFGNTNDDQRVDGWNNIANAVATSDASHLWHLHGRLKRKVLRDPAVFDRLFNALVYGTIPGSATPTPTGDDDMTPEQDRMLFNLDRLNSALLSGATNVTGLRLHDGTTTDLPLQLAKDVAELKARPTGAVVMSASDRDAIITGLVTGLAKDGGFLAAVAKAVADENYRRQQA